METTKYICKDPWMFDKEWDDCKQESTAETVGLSVVYQLLTESQPRQQQSMIRSHCACPSSAAGLGPLWQLSPSGITITESWGCLTQMSWDVFSGGLVWSMPYGLLLSSKQSFIYNSKISRYWHNCKYRIIPPLAYSEMLFNRRRHLSKCADPPRLLRVRQHWIWILWP